MLKGKVVLITGASSGIGALAASELARHGAIPVLTGRNLEKLKKHAEAISADCLYYKMDVADRDEIRQVVEQVLNKHGVIDILLNNAGYGEFRCFEEMPVDDFQAMMDTNYMGIVRCTKEVLPHMLKRGSGHIVNIASMAGKIGSAKSVSYTATKHAVLGFTNALRMEMAQQGIKVSAINPGPIDTEFFNIADPTGNYVKNVGWLMMKPEYVVKGILRVMDTGKAELDLPRKAGFAIKLYQLFPRTVDRLFGKWMNQK